MCKDICPLSTAEIMDNVWPLSTGETMDNDILPLSTAETMDNKVKLAMFLTKKLEPKTSLSVNSLWNHYMQMTA